MEPPNKDVLSIATAALDLVQKAVEEINQVKTSVDLLKALLGAQTVGKNPDRLRAFLAEFRRVEMQVSAQEHENTALVFEAVKHLLRKGSTEPDA
jgi:hypothetical protein